MIRPGDSFGLRWTHKGDTLSLQRLPGRQNLLDSTKGPGFFFIFMLLLSSNSSCSSNKVTTSGLVCVCVILILVLFENVVLGAKRKRPPSDDTVLCPVCADDCIRGELRIHLRKAHPRHDYNDKEIADLPSCDSPEMDTGSEEWEGEQEEEEERYYDDFPPTTKLTVIPGRKYLEEYAKRINQKRPKNLVSEAFMRKKEEEKRKLAELQKVWNKKLRDLNKKEKANKIEDSFEEIDEALRRSLNDEETTTTLFDKIQARREEMKDRNYFARFSASKEFKNQFQDYESDGLQGLEPTAAPSTQASNVQPDPIKGSQSVKGKVVCPYCHAHYTQRGLKKHIKSAHPDGREPMPLPVTPATTQPPPKYLDHLYRFQHQKEDYLSMLQNGTSRNPVPIYMKHKLRSEINKKIQMMPREHRRLESLMVRGRVINLPVYQKARRIGIYISKRDEIETRPIIEDILDPERRKECYVPWYQNLYGPKMRMLRLWHQDDVKMFKKTKEGVLVYEKPWLTKDAMKQDVPGLDLIIVPGRVFTRDGKRLGRWGDSYDAFLHELKAVSPDCKIMGLAFGQQIVDDFTFKDIVDPYEAKPVCMDYLVYDLNYHRLIEMKGKTTTEHPLFSDTTKLNQTRNRDYHDNDDPEVVAKCMEEFSKFCEGEPYFNAETDPAGPKRH
ncbi:hypothetical protein WDU94_015297 [Cyamophila willieti]